MAIQVSSLYAQWFFHWDIYKYAIYVPATLDQLRSYIPADLLIMNMSRLQRMWAKFNYRIDLGRSKNFAKYLQCEIRKTNDRYFSKNDFFTPIFIIRIK